MAEITIVYWRDIPAQVIVGRGRRGAKAPLPERFEKAIDRAAMRAGLVGTDAYLSQWRRVAADAPDGAPDEVARAAADRLASEHDAEMLRTLIENDGWSQPRMETK